MKELGTRKEVYTGVAKHTQSGFTRKDLVKRNGKILPKKVHRKSNTNVKRRSAKGGFVAEYPFEDKENIYSFNLAMTPSIRTLVGKLDASGGAIDGGSFFSTLKKVAGKVASVLGGPIANTATTVASQILSKMPFAATKAIAASLPAVKDTVQGVAEAIAGKAVSKRVSNLKSAVKSAVKAAPLGENGKLDTKTIANLVMNNLAQARGKGTVFIPGSASVFLPGSRAKRSSSKKNPRGAALALF